MLEFRPAAVGDAIRAGRRSAGMTQTELAQAANTSQAAVSMYEREARVPDLATLQRIASACGFDLRLSLVPRPIVNSLASYHEALVAADDEWRLRILLHDFGLVWSDAAAPMKRSLVEDEPAGVTAQWDAFIAAYVEHLCWHSGVEAPDWVYAPSRYLEQIWFPGPDLPTLRVEAIVHAPAAFEAHGVLIPARELEVV